MYPEGELVRYTFSIRSRRHYRLEEMLHMFITLDCLLWSSLGASSLGCNTVTGTHTRASVQPGHNTNTLHSAADHNVYYNDHFAHPSA